MLTLDLLDRTADRWRFLVTSRVERLGRVVHTGLLTGAVLLIALLGMSAQGQEMFRLLLEDPQPLQILFAILAAILLSGLLFFVYAAFVPYLGRYGELDSLTLKVLAVVALTIVAAAPWIAAWFSVLGLFGKLVASHEKLAQLVNDSNAIGEAGNGVLRSIETQQTNALFALGAIAGLGVVTVVLLWVLTGRRLRKASYLAIWAIAAAITLGLSLAAALFDWHLAALYAYLGPLATTMVSAISIITIALVVGWAARKTGSHLAVFLAGITLLFLGAVWLMPQIGLKTYPTPTTADKILPNFADEVAVWLARHPAGSQRKPLIVVSAQGGGMFAAIASSLFMARLQDADPKFNDHVLAISAVSGGAIGTVVYDALSGPGGCERSAPTTSTAPEGGHIERGIPAALLKPHLAPIIGNAPADILRPFVPWSVTDRAAAFSASLTAACPALGRDYAGHWVAGERRPALILNTTWMSNGHRVAFSPFTLREAGDGTLWSFDDVYAQRKDAKVESLATVPSLHGKPFKPTVAEAAVTSARFPGALPPLSLTAAGHRHNYGDGGYADSSGVSTALDLFEAVKKGVQARPDVVPLLVMMTFDYQPVTADHSGTPFVETWAPVTAILGVRENLAGIAIARAAKLSKDGENVMRIAVNPDDFGLALGLQLSRSSFEVLSLLVGRAEWCPDVFYKGTNVILRNSCMARRVLDSVKRAS